MSLKTIKSLKTQQSFRRTPSFDQAAYSTKGFTQTPQGSLTFLQESLESAKLNFFSEKQQKLQKLSEIQTLHEKNHCLKIKFRDLGKKNKENEEKFEKIQKENSIMRTILKELGVNYKDCEPLINKIELLELQNKNLRMEVQELNARISVQNIEIEEKKTELEEKNEKIKYLPVLNDEIKAKDELIEKIQLEIKQLKRNLKKNEKENEQILNSNSLLISELQAKNYQLTSKNSELTQSNKQTEEFISNLRQNLSNTQEKILNLEMIQHENSKLKADLRSKSLEALSLRDLNTKIQDFRKKLKEISLNLNGITCKSCNNKIEDAITAIPCGHSYCRRCEKGYTGANCLCCKTKIEALYKNELMNELKLMFIDKLSELLN